MSDLMSCSLFCEIQLNSSPTVIPSIPAAPLLDFTLLQAWFKFALEQTLSISSNVRAALTVALAVIPTFLPPQIHRLPQDSFLFYEFRPSVLKKKPTTPSADFLNVVSENFFPNSPYLRTT